jgi:uncharacterized sulfatase
MDAQLGVVLDALDQHDLWDHTIVVFWGDHGYAMGEHGGLQRKQALFESVARAPLVIAAPGLAKGKSCDALVEFIDIFPTLTDLAGVARPEGLHGKSLRPLLSDPAQKQFKPAAYTQTIRPGNIMGRTVRTDRWRFTQWGDGDDAPTELYDHQNDPNEWTNLAADPKHAATVAEMKRLLRNE